MTTTLREAIDIQNRAYADRWAGEPCQLNGQPAKILGRYCAFATIAQLEEGLDVEFSWTAVNRIMLSTRQFRSY